MSFANVLFGSLVLIVLALVGIAALLLTARGQVRDQREIRRSTDRASRWRDSIPQ